MDLTDKEKAEAIYKTINHCYDCGYENTCIMSAPDGKWRACKDFIPKEKKDGLDR